jgi:hypothetical protein
MKVLKNLELNNEVLHIDNNIELGDKIILKPESVLKVVEV